MVSMALFVAYLLFLILFQRYCNKLVTLFWEVQRMQKTDEKATYMSYKPFPNRLA